MGCLFLPVSSLDFPSTQTLSLLAPDLVLLMLMVYDMFCAMEIVP